MKRLLPLGLLPFLMLSAGCWHVWPHWFGSHGDKKPKETTAIASDVEESFRQRFVEKRTAELVTQGLRADVARQQALDEFHARYTYIRATGK